MLRSEKNKNQINEVKRELTAVNNRLNKTIADSTGNNLEDGDRRVLRQIRDKNIETFMLIQELELKGII